MVFGSSRILKFCFWEVMSKSKRQKSHFVADDGKLILSM